MVSVDGTDFRIPHSGRRFYTKKFNASGLRYEVALCIKSGKIVWVIGPYECGSWPDINIFRNALRSELDDGERVEADDGYVGDAPQHVKCPKSISNRSATELMQSLVRRRQEHVNKRFKQWGILKQLYRHDITKHGDVFMAIVAITELIIENGEPLMDVEYEDPYLDDHYYPENLEAAVADEDDNSSVGGSSSDEETIDRS